MTAVTQKIPNFIGGISQQPDELKPEGSLREALNVIPDVTDGLKKRPGSRLVNPVLTTEEGSWFHFNFADEQKYIGKVNFNGEVNIFNCEDGLAIPVQYAEYDPSDENSPENNPSTGYPNCVIADYNSTKLVWLDKQRLYNEANVVYNNALNTANNFEVNQKEVYYQLDEITETRVVSTGAGRNGLRRINEKYTLRQLIEGYIRRRGSDIRTDESPGSDWVYSRGDLKEEGITVLYDDTMYYNVDLYENVYTRNRGAEKAVLDQNAADQLVVVNAAKAEMDAAFALFAAEADNCGLTDQQTALKGLIESDVVPTYLRHDRQNQLRNLVVGNRIFLINPEIETGMNSSGIPARPRENFIEINVAAGMQDYSVELVAEDTGVTPYTEVREVVVLDGVFTDGDGTCPLQGTERQTFNDGDKQNLTIDLTITGVQVLEGDGNSQNDYNCKYRADAKIINPGVNWNVGAIIEMQVEGRTYKIKVTETETLYTAEGELITVPTSPNGVDTPVKVTEILQDLKTAIETKDDRFTVSIIGNGVWVTHTDPTYVWRFSVPNKALMNVTTSEVNSVTQLPTQCRAGYTVKVSNTESDNDDYYAAFKTEEAGVDGPGTWIETVAPNINRYFNPATMPHQIARQANGDFIVSPVEWEPRRVGDVKTNPKPGFMSRPDENKICTIENMVFFRNRLCILSGDSITCSRSGDYYNFWYASALTVADNDPVDLAAGSTSSSSNAVLSDAIEIGQGLVCFSGGEQFILSSSSEAFTPNQARFSRVGTYRYSGFQNVIRNEPVTSVDRKEVNGVPVFSLGTSVGFLADSGLNSRLLEMFNIGQNAEASVNELTKPVSKLIPYGVNILADSKDNNLIALGNKGSRDVWLYRYFDNDQRRVQSAWFKWTLPAPLAYHCIMDDVYWSISYSKSDSIINQGKPAIVSLQRIDLKDELATAFVYDKYIESSEAGALDLRADNGRPYQAHMDNYRIAQPSQLTYYDHIDQTYFRAPIINYKALADVGKLRAYMLSPTILQRDSILYGPNQDFYFEKIGTSIPIRVEEDSLGTWFVMDGNWSNTRMMIGYVYDMQLELPTFYPSKTATTANGPITRRDIRCYLNLHRLKINFGQVGVYDTTLKVRGRNDYTEMYECKTMDDYPANEIAFDEIKTQVVPVYAKNTDTSVIISSSHPSPCTLHSLEWEGDYNTKWYRSA
tara:strand:+ start:575 stop:4150 length:3576 start_codon:yes stop_codon:yes gene_type:complete